MSFLDFLKPKFDPNSLTEYEEKLAELLLKIINQVKTNPYADIEKDRDVLIVSLYYQSFKRANKKVYDLTAVSSNPLFFMENKNALSYVGLYNTIKESIIGLLGNPAVIHAVNSKRDIDESILMIVNKISREIKNI